MLRKLSYTKQSYPKINDEETRKSRSRNCKPLADATNRLPFESNMNMNMTPTVPTTKTSTTNSITITSNNYYRKTITNNNE